MDHRVYNCKRLSEAEKLLSNHPGRVFSMPGVDLHTIEYSAVDHFLIGIVTRRALFASGFFVNNWS